MSIIPQRCKSPTGAAYADMGSGEPVVLIHGVGMRLEAWGPQIDALRKTHRIIAVDLPGHGESRPLPDDARLSEYVAFFADFLDWLKLGPVNVAGHSMGALIAGGLAAERPQAIARVALLNGVYRRGEAARQAVMARAAEIVSGDFDREAPLKRWFGTDQGRDQEEAYALCRTLLATVDAKGYATAYRAFAEGDAVYADHWPSISCPALFLTGDGDLNSTPDMAEAMAKAAQHGKAVVIAGHRHMVNLTAPDAVNAALAAWLNQPHSAERLGHEH